jgi:hypothetical protein
MPRVFVIAAWSSALLAASVGCTTTRTSDTARTGIEQLLISNAVDQALEKYDFRSLQGRKVFIDETYLDSVDKGYLLSSIRERILYNGGQLCSKAEDAEITLEIRSGGVGTDNLETFVGIPKTSVPGVVPIEIPDIKIWNKTSQTGTAKIGILAYETKTGSVYQHGGQALARSDDTKWFLLGVGPFQSGTVRNEVETGAANPIAIARSMPSQPPAYIARGAEPFGPPHALPPTPATEPYVHPASGYSDVYR